MPFLSLSFANFRNLENASIDLLSREVYFVGENGQGKSNILESLYMSSYGASFRTRNESELVKEGQSAYSIRSIFRDRKEHSHSIHIYFENGKKRIEKNAKALHDRKDLLDTVPCVLYSHEDLDFASGSPERKRFFIDQTISMFDSSYVDILRTYKKVLKSKNLVLRDKRLDLLDSYDVQLCYNGIKIMQMREKAIRNFNKIFAKMYAEVSGIENVVIDYSPSWKVDSVDHVMKILSEKRDIDIQMNTCMSGPHRDRIRFSRNGVLFIPRASTGQRRLLSLLLRSAQAYFYTDSTGGNLPVLLMDDVLLELDPDKRQRFNSLLPNYDQLFCTFLPGEPFERYKRSTTKVYSIQGGRWYVS